MRQVITHFALILSMVNIFPFTISSQEMMDIPMTSASWDTTGAKAEFITYKGFPSMKLQEGSRVFLKDYEFEDGTIEFDTEFGDARFVGIYFRQKDNRESEWLYLRCYRAGNPSGYDAIQYASIVKGVTLWDMQPHYQGPADFNKNEWNHVKLIISGERMLVYVNNMDIPVLDIGKLEGNHKNGMIGLAGNAYFTNVRIKPGETEGLSPKASIDPVYNDPNYIREWEVTSPAFLPFGEDVIGKPLPEESTEFNLIAAERHGLINLTREYGRDPDNARRVVWLKVNVHSEYQQQKRLDLGFSDEVWVFINRDLLYLDKNYYNSAIMKPPHGRISIENTSIELPLREGNNEILIAVANNFFGWGIVARLKDLEGIKL